VRRQLEKHDRQQLTVAMSARVGSAMTTIEVVTLMVNPSHSSSSSSSSRALLDAGKKQQNTIICSWEDIYAGASP